MISHLMIDICECSVAFPFDAFCVCVPMIYNAPLWCFQGKRRDGLAVVSVLLACSAVIIIVVIFVRRGDCRQGEERCGAHMLRWGPPSFE